MPENGFGEHSVNGIVQIVAAVVTINVRDHKQHRYAVQPKRVSNFYADVIVHSVVVSVRNIIERLNPKRRLLCRRELN